MRSRSKWKVQAVTETTTCVSKVWAILTFERNAYLAGTYKVPQMVP